MLVKMSAVLVKIAVMMMAPGSAPAPPEARGREGPFFLFFFFLDLLPRWEKGFPSGPWLPWLGRGESPSEIGSISLFLRSLILLLHRFFYIWRSVTPIGWIFRPDFSCKISFLAAKVEPQHCFALILPPENPKYSKIILRPFLSRLDFVWYWFSAKDKTCNRQELALGTGSIC